MATDEAPRDLQKGISIDDVPDGTIVAGKCGDRDIVLVRRGEELFALDAFCTHYHAPLADGMVIGETLRCPWHHACFELRTGNAACAPAMQPLAVYETVRDGDVIRVLPRPKTRTTPPKTRADEHIVIVGAGAAGSFAASELRRGGFAGRVTLVTREAQLPYDKPNLSKDYLAGRASADWIPLRTEADYANDGVDLRLNTIVESIDARRSTLTLRAGETIPYDRLILATGASARRLDVAHDATANVLSLRTWADADALRAATEHARNVVVIGASFIGLEVAASLRERGLNVTVVGREAHPLEKVLGRDAAAFVQRTHEEHGVRFRLGRSPVEIRSHSVLLDDGSAEAADVVVAGVGVLPDLALAERAGLEVNGGIVVNELLQTSVPNIFAAGDVARFPHARSGRSIRVEHWAAAARQGQAAARNAMGKAERFRAEPFFWSQHYDLVLSYVGHAEHANDVQQFGSLDEHNAALVYREEGRVAAVATLFRDDVSLAVEAAMERGDDDDAILALVRRAF